MRRAKHTFTYNGEKLTISQIAKRLEVSYDVVYSRIFYSGWDIDEVMNNRLMDKSEVGRRGSDGRKKIGYKWFKNR